MEKRIDIYLSEHYFSSRAQAQDAIKEGRVKVNDKIVRKASEKVSGEEQIEIAEKELSFASRGGHKLYDALLECGIDLKGKVVLDIGASTGGFTDVCLQLGARFVYALDAGKGQLIERLQLDPRVKNMEGINARYLRKDMFSLPIDFVCMDVSFISIKLLIDALLSVLEAPFTCLFLIKPQFEAGKAHIGKKGIVKDKKVHQRILEEYIAYFQQKKLGVEHVLRSHTLGRDGNQEYLIHLTHCVNNKYFDIVKVVMGKEK